MKAFESILQSIDLDRLKIVPLTSDDSIAVDDSPEKCALVEPDGSPFGVLFLSSPSHPDFVGRAVRRGNDVAARIGTPLSDALLTPVHSGEYEGRSYVIWPWCRTLPANSILRRLKARSLAPKVVDWLLSVSGRTCRECDAEQRIRLYDEPLQSFAQTLTSLNADQMYIELCTKYALKKEWSPRTVVMHGDLWLENIMLPASRDGRAYGFNVIDWAGAMVDGHPFYDLFSLGRIRPHQRPDVASLHANAQDNRGVQ